MNDPNYLPAHYQLPLFIYQGFWYFVTTSFTNPAFVVQIKSEYMDGQQHTTATLGELHSYNPKHNFNPDFRPHEGITVTIILPDGTYNFHDPRNPLRAISYQTELHAIGQNSRPGINPLLVPLAAMCGAGLRGGITQPTLFGSSEPQPPSIDEEFHGILRVALMQALNSVILNWRHLQPDTE